ncbi:hypothetical protein [Flavobacterium sp. LC2016-12]|uniref:hypothetical protein n=1 Tax=Flavobacterium sp. LC2016-12 TaxID=2783794 RepID=UPI00188BB5FE|nr:hypothetical protein [Flavobacterium sp. LC2016-12]MBF4466892.1 hypothetical protein [Flavobacterium sp. LC2016-12]
MKKIIYLLFLLQAGLLAAQTETLVTVNGKKVTVNPNALSTADNGLTTDNGNLQLGGELTKSTVLTTTPTSTLALTGLQTGVETNNIVTVDANGILTTTLKQSLTSDDLGNHTATEHLNISNKHIQNIQTAFINNGLEVLDRTTSNTKYFSLNKDNGLFSIWNSGTSSNALSIDETNNNTSFASTISFPNIDDIKIALAGSSNGARISYYGLIISNASGQKGVADSGQFNWSNYSGPSGSQKEIMRLTFTGVGLGTTAPTNAMHVKAVDNPIILEGLTTSPAATNVKLVVGADGIIKKSMFPKTYKTTSLAPGESYSVTLQVNLPITSFLVMTGNECGRTALNSFRSYNNTLSFLGGQGRNIPFTATVLNDDGSSLKLEAEGVVYCQDGGGSSQFDFTITKAGAVITITNNGNVNKGYTVVQNGI